MGVSAFWNRIVSLFRPSNSSAPEGPIGDGRLLGTKLSEAKGKSSLFTWFFFTPVGDEIPANGTTAYKPSGEAFRALVTLNVTTNAEGIISRLQLVLARSFIDDPAKCAFAADLAKSFLGEGANFSAGDAVGQLADEISAGGFARTSQPVIARAPLPKSSGSPPAAYQTYAGQGKAQTLLYPSGKVQVALENTLLNNEPVLTILISPKG